MTSTSFREEKAALWIEQQEPHTTEFWTFSHKNPSTAPLYRACLRCYLYWLHVLWIYEVQSSPKDDTWDQFLNALLRNWQLSTFSNVVFEILFIENERDVSMLWWTRFVIVKLMRNANIAKRSLKSRFSFVPRSAFLQQYRQNWWSSKSELGFNTSNAFRYPCIALLQGFPRKPIRHWAWLRVGPIIFSKIFPTFVFLRITCMTRDESRKYFSQTKEVKMLFVRGYKIFLQG